MIKQTSNLVCIYFILGLRVTTHERNEHVSTRETLCCAKPALRHTHQLADFSPPQTAHNIRRADKDRELIV